MENQTQVKVIPPKNLFARLKSNKFENFARQFKGVVLDGIDAFGLDSVLDIVEECKKIYEDYIANDAKEFVDEIVKDALNE